jgi:hydrogenase nickel incorporation protein HypA/HybF
MHELSIVEALIEQVGEALAAAGNPGRPLRLRLSVGRLSGVCCESLRFAFNIASPGTIVENAELDIDQPPAVCRCRDCGARNEIADLVAECPSCRGRNVVIEEGREMILQSIDIEEQAT